jgi:hypothetical protein
VAAQKNTAGGSQLPLALYKTILSSPLPELWLLKTRRWLLRAVVASALTVRKGAGKGEQKPVLVSLMLLGFDAAGHAPVEKIWTVM